MAEEKKLLIIGGKGALGQALVQYFKYKNAWVASADHGDNDQAHFSIVINPATTTKSDVQADWIEQKLRDELKLDEGSVKFLDGIICVAGGWAGGNILTKGFHQSVEQMWKQSVESSVVAAYLAGRILKEGGLLVMTGAQAALSPTPTMIGYGMAKAAVHHLIKSLASEGSGLPKNAVVVGLLPRILDTPNNRKFATGNEDFDSWTPLEHVTGLIEKWLAAVEHKEVQNGSLMVLFTRNGETSVEVH